MRPPHMTTTIMKKKYISTQTVVCELLPNPMLTGSDVIRKQGDYSDNNEEENGGGGILSRRTTNQWEEEEDE